MPLLHAAAGDLAPAAVAAWQAEQRSSGWWEEARRLLFVSAPIARDELATALRRSAEASPADLRQLPELLRRLEQAQLPEVASVKVKGWAVRQLCERDGYIHALAQSALLECYAGLHVAASLDRRSDDFRQAPASAPPQHACPPTRRLTVTSDDRDVEPPSPAQPRAGADESRDEAVSATINEAGAQPNRELPGRSPATAAADAAAGAAPRADATDNGEQEETPVPHAQAPGNPFPPFAWAWLDDISLHHEFQVRLPTLQSVPRFLTPGVRRAFLAALTAIADARSPSGCLRAWKLFLLLPRLLLTRSDAIGAQGRAELLHRLELFWRGSWAELHRLSRRAAERQGRPQPERLGDTSEARAARACTLVKRGELSRARQVLTAAALAPGDATTLQALTDPDRRPTARLRDVPNEVLSYSPDEAVAVTVGQVAEALRSSKRGSAAGLSGATLEMYKLLLDDEVAIDLFTGAVNRLARADVPHEVAEALAVSRLTALRKPHSGVRGIATGDVFRR